MSNSNSNTQLKVPKKKVLLKSKRRKPRRRFNIDLEYNLVGSQNSQINDEPESLRPLHPIPGLRSKRQPAKNMKNEKYRCDVLKSKSKKKCLKKIQYFTTIIKSYVDDFIKHRTEENTNLLIDKLIELKHYTALTFGDEHQNEIVSDFFIYIFNHNEKSYDNLTKHPKFNNILRHKHVSKKTILNKVKTTFTKMRSKGRVAPNNTKSRESTSRSASRRRSASTRSASRRRSASTSRSASRRRSASTSRSASRRSSSSRRRSAPRRSSSSTSRSASRRSSTSRRKSAPRRSSVQQSTKRAFN